MVAKQVYSVSEFCCRVSIPRWQNDRKSPFDKKGLFHSTILSWLEAIYSSSIEVDRLSSPGLRSAGVVPASE